MLHVKATTGTRGTTGNTGDGKSQHDPCCLPCLFPVTSVAPRVPVVTLGKMRHTTSPLKAIELEPTHCPRGHAPAPAKNSREPEGICESNRSSYVSNGGISRL